MTAAEYIIHKLMRGLIILMYRVSSRYLDRIPKEGGAVIICNHVSFFDAILLASIFDRPIRFVMDHQIFQWPILNFIFKTMKAIPIAPRKENKEIHDNSFIEIENHLINGELVCIFPEGMITRTGDINKFKPGVLQILRNTPVPVIPVSISGLWRSIFSRRSNTPIRFRARIDVNIGEIIPPEDVTLKLLETVVGDLRGDRK